MPNRKQIIIFSVLGLIALLIGYFKNPLNLSMGKRAEVQGPIALTRNLTPEEKELVGTYERYTGSYTSRWVFLDNGIRESYINGKKEEAEHKWSIVNNEIKVKYNADNILIYRLNPDNSMTLIAHIDKDGKRTDYPKESQYTFKKINQPQPTRNITLEEKDIVGTYEAKIGATTHRHVYLDNGKIEYWYNGKDQGRDLKWSIVDNELHVKYPNNIVGVWRLNPDNSLTYIATIRNEKRIVTSKDNQNTFKKIK